MGDPEQRLLERLIDTEIAALANRVFEAACQQVGSARDLGQTMARSQREGLLRLARQQPAQLERLAHHQCERADKLGKANTVAIWRLIHRSVATKGPKAELSLRATAERVVDERGEELTKQQRTEAVRDWIYRLAGPFVQRFAALCLAESGK